MPKQPLVNSPWRDPPVADANGTWQPAKRGKKPAKGNAIKPEQEETDEARLERLAVEAKTISILDEGLVDFLAKRRSTSRS